MKTKFRVLLVSILVLGIAIVYSTSCKKAVDKATESCTPMSSGCGTTIQVCANSTSAWYTYNGITYRCASSLDCTEAAAEVIAAACPKKSPEEFAEAVQELLDLTEIVREENKLNE